MSQRLQKLSVFIAANEIKKGRLAHTLDVGAPQISIWLATGSHHVLTDDEGNCKLVRIVKEFNLIDVPRR